ncbi:hypothetical protein [Streptomyces olivaceoviridis]|uniref:hypothetical protein n=1 Tax=Streptomyces olivaceoviridis TaxID=1921 RepID=UPI0037013BCD
MADHDQGYIEALADQLCCRHAPLLATAENDLAILRSRIALTVAYIHDPAVNRDARINLAQRLGLPKPSPEAP